MNQKEIERTIASDGPYLNNGIRLGDYRAFGRSQSGWFYEIYDHDTQTWMEPSRFISSRDITESQWGWDLRVAHREWAKVERGRIVRRVGQIVESLQLPGEYRTDRGSREDRTIWQVQVSDLLAWAQSKDLGNTVLDIQRPVNLYLKDLEYLLDSAGYSDLIAPPVEIRQPEYFLDVWWNKGYAGVQREVLAAELEREQTQTAEKRLRKHIDSDGWQASTYAVLQDVLGGLKGQAALDAADEYICTHPKESSS